MHSDIFNADKRVSAVSTPNNHEGKWCCVFVGQSEVTDFHLNPSGVRIKLSTTDLRTSLAIVM